jgi:hypothetical protein
LRKLAIENFLQNVFTNKEIMAASAGLINESLGLLPNFLKKNVEYPAAPTSEMSSILREVYIRRGRLGWFTDEQPHPEPDTALPVHLPDGQVLEMPIDRYTKVVDLLRRLQSQLSLNCILDYRLCLRTSFR